MMKLKSPFFVFFLFCLWQTCAFGQDVVQPVDSDLDGVSDTEEASLQTDPKVCDSDGDGLGDGLETGEIHPKAEQADCRGLSVAGSNFQTPSLLDPLSVDSDHDGLEDGAEDANQNGWIDFNETDPTTADTDEDGLADGFEEKLGQKKKGLPFDLSALSNGEHCSPPADKRDVDCDGLANALDADSDNDACLDGEEGRGDQDENGILDVWEEGVKNCSASSSPVAGGGVSGGESKSPSASDEEDKVYFSEVLPSKGGGACQMNPGRKLDGAGFSFLIFLFSLFIASIPASKNISTRKGID